MLMCSSFPDDVLGAGAEPKGETNTGKKPIDRVPSRSVSIF